MKDMKFIIIIILTFFGFGIMAEINDYDYNVNNTGIMYQENDNIVLNENNRFYDYDIDFNLNESYLQYSPVKKGGLLDNYNNRSKNLAVPDLTGKEYLGDGVYRLYNDNGITIDYNVYNGEYKINGTSTAYFSVIIFNILPDTEYTLSYIAVSGTLTDGSFNIPVFSPSILIIQQLQENINKQSTFTTTRQTTLRFETGSGRTFDNYAFKLKLEQGDTATPYEVPYIPGMRIDFKGSNQVEYINPYVEQVIKIDDIKNVNNIEFELLNIINPAVFNWNITTNSNMPFVRFYNNQTKLLYDFTDIDEVNNIGNNLLGSRSNFMNTLSGAINLVNTFYTGFQRLFNKQFFDTLKDSLKSLWPIMPKWPIKLPWLS